MIHYHGTIFRFPQQREEGLDDSDTGPHVEIEDLLGLGDREVGDWHIVLGTGVVEEHVQCAACQFDDRGDAGRYGFFR